MKKLNSFHRSKSCRLARVCSGWSAFSAMSTHLRILCSSATSARVSFSLVYSAVLCPLRVAYSFSHSEIGKVFVPFGRFAWRYTDYLHRTLVWAMCSKRSKNGNLYFPFYKRIQEDSSFQL